MVSGYNFVHVPHYSFLSLCKWLSLYKRPSSPRCITALFDKFKSVTLLLYRNKIDYPLSTIWPCSLFRHWFFVLTLFIAVKPSNISLTGIDGPIKEGTAVVVYCIVDGARPAATITWFNNSNALDKSSVETNQLQVYAQRVFFLCLNFPLFQVLFKFLSYLFAHDKFGNKLSLKKKNGWQIITGTSAWRFWEHWTSMSAFEEKNISYAKYWKSIFPWNACFIFLRVLVWSK